MNVPHNCLERSSLVPEAKGIKKKSSAVTCFKLVLPAAYKRSVCAEEEETGGEGLPFTLGHERGRNILCLGDKTFATKIHCAMK